MTSDIKFRETSVDVGDHKLTIKKKEIKEIFTFNTPPYIIVGASGTGKTTLCLDIINTHSKDCTKIYYVTSTEENILNKGKPGDISLIPKIFRRKPTFEVIRGIWEDLTNEASAHTFEINKYIAILKKIWQKAGKVDVIIEVLKSLEEQREKIIEKQNKIYMKEFSDEKKAKELSINDASAFYIECLSRLLMDAARLNDTSELTTDEMLILNALVSAKPKIMLILDDVTSELNALKTQRRMVSYKNQTIKVGEAYKNILIDILTRGRHYGILVCLFVHTIEIIPKDLIVNIVLLDGNSLQKTLNIRSFPTEMKKILSAFSRYVFKPEFLYHFIHMNNQAQEWGVGKAEVILNPLEFSDVNSELIRAYDLVAKSIEGEVIENVENEAESEESEDDEDTNKNNNEWF